MEYKDIFLVGGINRNISPFLHTEGELLEVNNFTTSKIGVLKKTGDYEIKNAQVTTSQNILGGYDFQRADGTHKHLIAVDGAANAEIYIDESGTWTTQSQSLTSTYPVRFTHSPALDVAFSCNYADATRSYNGTAWSTVTNVTSAPKAKYIIAFGERIYLLNCIVDDVTYISRAYRSSTVSSTDITWDTTNDWIFFDDEISGVGRNGENMFVGCQNSCWIYTLSDQRYQTSRHGCVSHDGIDDYGTWTFFPSRDGMYVYDGGQDTKCSLAVQDYWDAIPSANLSSIKSKILGDHLYIYIGDVTLEGRSLTNVVLDYNILQNSWTKMSLGENVLNMHTFIGSLGKELFFGNDNGEVFKLFSSLAQDTVAFGSYIETPWYYGSGPTIVDDWRELWVHGNDLSGLKVLYRVDDYDWIPVGEVNGFTDIVRFSASGKRIKFLLTETSKNNLFELHSLSIGYLSKFSENREGVQ